MRARDYRCCMCPQINSVKRICPPGPGKAKESICDFVVVWTDLQGWKYRVMRIAGTYKGAYQDDKHKGDVGWKGMRQMQSKNSFDEAQEALNCYAKLEGWYPLDTIETK